MKDADAIRRNTVVSVGSVAPVTKREIRQFSVSGVDLDFELAPGVAVPNVYSLLLAEVAMAVTEDNSSVIDVGCGCGIVGSFLGATRAKSLTLLDISPLAVSLAVSNASRLLPSLEVTGLVADGLSSTEARNIDLIVCQPPQTPAPPDQPSLDPEITDGGPDGLSMIGPLIADVADRLAPTGKLLLVLASYLREPALQQIAGRSGLQMDLLAEQPCELTPMTIVRRDYLAEALNWHPSRGRDGKEIMSLKVFSFRRHQ